MFSKNFVSLINKQLNRTGVFYKTISSDSKYITINCGKKFKKAPIYLNISRSIHQNESKLGLEKVATYDSDVDALSRNIHESNKQWVEADDVLDAKAGSFENFRISDEIISKLKSLGIPHLFPVQSNTFDAIYDGFDVIVQARTGSGKTMSYAIPLIEKLSTQIGTNSKNRIPKLLVLTPTRELANQVSNVVSSLSGYLKVVPVYGGVSINMQESQIRRGCDIVVGTPGRILDLISRRSLDLTQLNHVVLDEVDRMLDMGFADDVDNILKNRYRPNDRDSNPQTLLFSATVPSWVQKTARKYLSRDIRMIDLIGKNTNKTAVNVKHSAMLCGTSDRVNAVVDILNKHTHNESSTVNAPNLNENNDDADAPRIIVFCQTKREVDQMGSSKHLKGKVAILHGDVSQVQREITLKKFKNGQLCCLIATDVAARGLDIPDVDVVVQCSPPQDVESYIHRSGRTGRAGKSGESIMLYTPEEVDDVFKIEQVAGFKFSMVQFQRSMQNVKQDILRSINNVSQKTREKFATMATDLTKEVGMDKLLSSALAVMSGFEQKSLITYTPGLTTVLLSTPKQQRIFNRTHGWDIIQKLLPAEITEKARNLRICSDFKSLVFDIPCYKEEVLMKTLEKDSNHVITIPDQLPPIIQSETREFSRSRSSGFKSFNAYNNSRSRSYDSFGSKSINRNNVDDDDVNDNSINNDGDDNDGEIRDNRYSRLSHSFDRYKPNKYSSNRQQFNNGNSYKNYGYNNNANYGSSGSDGGYKGRRNYNEGEEFILKHRRGLAPTDE